MLDLIEEISRLNLINNFNMLYIRFITNIEIILSVLISVLKNKILIYLSNRHFQSILIATYCIPEKYYTIN